MRRTQATLKVLAAFTDKPDDEHYGLDLARTTGLASGTLYPILARLEADGWLESRWEERPDPGPRRRFYRLTDTGREGAAVALEPGPRYPNPPRRPRNPFAPLPREIPPS